MKFGWIIRLGLPALTNLVIEWHLIIGPPNAGYLRGEPGLTIGFGNKEVIIGEVSSETVSIWVMQNKWGQNLIITLFSLPSPWHQYPIIVPIPGGCQTCSYTRAAYVQLQKPHLTISTWRDSCKWQSVTLTRVCVFVCKGEILTSRENECERRLM